ncbi:hypothetical protein CM15mP37_11670 [bacterium]|nr:MAG: hypothetical protein CM15mP37_11670 [bacterium]
MPQAISPSQAVRSVILPLLALLSIPPPLRLAAAGATTIDVAADKFTDTLGNLNASSTQFKWTYDNIKPVPSIVVSNKAGTAIANGATTGDDSLHAAITISEPIVGFDLSYFTFTGNGSASDLILVNDTSATMKLIASASGTITARSR